MSVAFESVCAELGLSDKDDPATRLVASKIIEFAQSGVLDAARLRSMTRKEFELEWLMVEARRFPPPWLPG
jgi:hypothetical protein